MKRINAEDVSKIEALGDGFWFVYYWDDVCEMGAHARITKSEVQHLFEKGCVDV